MRNFKSIVAGQKKAPHVARLCLCQSGHSSDCDILILYNEQHVVGRGVNGKH